MATQKTKTKETLRGEERIRQLMEEFPEIAPTEVIQADTQREGIRPNETSRQVGRWALAKAPAYFNYDKEDVYTSEEAREGYILSPAAYFLSNGAKLAPSFDSRSPYEFRYEGNGRYQLYRDGEAIEEVFFPPRPQWFDRKTSSGKPMPSVISPEGGDSLKIGALPYCEYGKDNLECKYCNINSAEAVKKGLGMERLMGKRDQEVYETYVAAAQEVKLLHMGMSGGVLLDPSKEADNYARLAKVPRRAMKDAGYEVPIWVVCQALERERTR